MYAFLVCSIFFNANSLIAQWIQTNGPYGGDNRSIVESNGNLFADSHGGGVFVSADNGKSWVARNVGLDNHYVSSLAVIGTYLFAGTLGRGVFLSTIKPSGRRVVLKYYKHCSSS
jgi:hypothetical protein